MLLELTTIEQFNELITKGAVEEILNITTED